ncbi:MAG: hypothetical protein J7621_25340 [Niastella sp.]|nr:hypothetical protein [Niastella sp.]
MITFMATDPKHKDTNPAIIDPNNDNETDDTDFFEYDEEAELKAMGLLDEETAEGFDWTLGD